MTYGTVNADVIGTSVSGSNLGAGNASIMKNRLINGAMVIDQRNAGASVNLTSNQYTLDRWGCYQTNTSALSIQQNAGSVTPPTGFSNYLGATSLAATSLSAGSYFMIQQRIEGYNTADLAWGTANAKTVTLSFWVRSSLTGTFGGSLRNGAGDRAYPYTYTISSANTWEYKTVTIAGCSDGTWATNNTASIYVEFALGVGSTYSGTAGTWANGVYISATGATSVVGTNGATFYITGVQLEVGSSATGFEYRQYGTELQLCQRYYQKTYNQSVVPASNSKLGIYSMWFSGVGATHANFYPFKTPMRSTSTILFWDGAGNASAVSLYNGSWTDNIVSSAAYAIINPSETGFMLSYYGGPFSGTDTYSLHYTASSEL